jgi:2-keto-4-pentenoate hydratase/2-oxohepta-3-ene-1,7-dioic acid hydratase in catechol pathway
VRLARLAFPDGPAAAFAAGGGLWIRAGAVGVPDADAANKGSLERLAEAARALSQADVERLVGSEDAQAGDAGLLSPLERVGKVMAVGMNYRDHIAEVGAEPPAQPLLFGKFPSSIAGPYDPVEIDFDLVTKADYEVELGVVIGRAGRDLSPERALGHVAGYLVANDVSSRNLQFSEAQWIRSKSFDGFCPIGPWLTTADAVPDPQSLRLWTKVNGELRQSSNTREMLFSVPEILSFCSRGITLHPGDLVLTGTPPGVAMGMPDTPWLRPGDVVECGIEGLGSLRNEITAYDAGRLTCVGQRSRDAS